MRNNDTPYKNGRSRRDFLRTSGAAALGAAAGLGPAARAAPAPRMAHPDRPPNLLFIFTDQQTIHAMSAAGNPWVQTPAMDSLCRIGVRFEQSYCADPVCGPSRGSLVTGRLPHETGVNFNGEPPDPSIETLGERLRTAGYRTVWGGKWHLPESYPLRNYAGQTDTVPGFELLPFYDPTMEWGWGRGDDTDGPLADAAVRFLRRRQDEPFFLSVSFHNPHDICYYPLNPALFPPLPHPDAAPPLPPNAAINPNEPEYVRDCRERTYYGSEIHKTRDWSDAQWRAYRYAYYRMTERVDRQVGRVLAALEYAGLEENTWVVFTSDHGDGVGAHRWAAKLSLYEESTCVPMIVARPGTLRGNRVDRTHLVSGLDICPTFCEMAGIEPPPRQRGQSLLPVLRDPGRRSDREFVVAELATDPKRPDRKGRMIRDSRYKYNLYSYGARNEQLFDLRTDPGETTNLAAESTHRDVKEALRRSLDRWMEETDDDFRIVS